MSPLTLQNELMSCPPLTLTLQNELMSCSPLTLQNELVPLLTLTLQNELMSPLVSSSVHLTSNSLAIMDDSGWYAPR